MHNPLRRSLPGALLFVLLAVPAAAQDRGSITGRVRDKKTRHAIPFATVTVVGAQRGALTDSEGQFVVSGVAPGTYEVRVQFLGYGPASKPGVVVAAGRPSAIDFDLEEIVVHEEKAIEVTAERRLVDVKQSATVRSVNAAEIRNLPVLTVTDVLQHQAGISTENDQIHVRGGRADETIFLVNGVANRDLVTGTSTAGQLNARSVAEVNVATGAYDVRYGNALSGVVEIKLKEGADHVGGGLTTGAGSYGGRAFQLVLGGPLLKEKLNGILDVTGALFETRFRFLDLPPQGGYHNFGGPIFSSSIYSPLHSGYEDSFLGYHFKYGDFFSPSEDNRWALRYGLTWKPTTRDKWNFNFSKRIAIDQGFSRTTITASGNVQDPALPWQWAHRIDHANTIFEDNVQASLEWRRTLSTSSYVNFQVSRYYYAKRTDVLGKDWTQYQQPNDLAKYGGTPDSVLAKDYFNDTGDDNVWEDIRNTTWGLLGSMVHRFKRHHELEFGLEHQFQTVQSVRIENPWIADPSGLGDQHDLWLVHPWVGDLYVRDRLDYEGFVGNLGVRADYWFLGREVEGAINDPTNPRITPETRTEFENTTHSFYGRRYKLKLSPRVMVAHPITDRSSFFFNYGQFSQIPTYRWVYSKLTSISSDAFQTVGNPNLNPEVSVNYEIGARNAFTPRVGANLTFFVKDVYDYPVATPIPALKGTSTTPPLVYLNGHFARSRGFEIEVERLRANYWSGKISYSYQQTKGKSSDPSEQKVVQETGGNPAEVPLSETYVRWNRPHKLTANFDLRFDKEAPHAWMRYFGLNVFVQGLSGHAYTPENPYSNASAAPYSKNAPFQVTTDVKLNRSFAFVGRRLDLSFTGTNIFNNYLIYRVDPQTGRGIVYGVGSYPVFGTSAYDKQHYVDDPSNYGPGAQWRMALDYDF